MVLSCSFLIATRRKLLHAKVVPFPRHSVAILEHELSVFLVVGWQLPAALIERSSYSELSNAFSQLQRIFTARKVGDHVYS